MGRAFAHLLLVTLVGILPPILHGGAIPLGAGAGVQAPAASGYVFTYFTKNGEDGLHLAWSGDGYRWEKVADGRSLLTPTVGTSKLMRDPCVTRGPDGRSHMVWTSGWNEPTIDAYVEQHYAAMRSRDLVTWEDVTAKMAFPDEGTPVRMRHGTVIAVPGEILTSLRTLR